jgi:aspartyl-tRNA(Asn)/glutamyl-tRNA(Gln) amidotransferase subunit A
MARKVRSSIESQIEMWSGIRPPNERALEMAAGLDAILEGFEALRGQIVFEDEPSSFEASLQACKERGQDQTVEALAAPGTVSARPSSLLDMSLVEAAEAIARGETTSLALTKASIEAFGSKDRAISSLIRLDAEEALEAAEGLDKLRRAGRLIGPLHGVPLAHKDMYYQAGKPSTGGSKIRQNFKPGHTSTALARLEAAGSITVGALNMAEFAQNPTGHNAHFGDCRNPWNPAYCTGGSSSGSGASVAARFVYGALGSDTGGSIRLPATMCGITGIKGTQTRVSRHGAMPLSFTCDNVGPLARSARDCARLMRIIAGHDPADPTSARQPVPDYEAGLVGHLRGLRIGVPENFFLDGADVEVVRTFEASLAVLKDAGAQIVHVKLPHMDAVDTYVSIVSRVEAATIHATWMRERAGDYAVHLSARLYGGYAIPATYYVEALSRRGPILKAFCDDVFAKVDVFAAPTLRCKVPTRAETDIDSGESGAVEAFSKCSINTRAINYLGLPSISVSCGLDSRGLPIGLMLQGRPFGEGTILRAADAYQERTDWHGKKPALAA